MNSELSIEAPRNVDVGAIDRELRNLWREASADTEHPVARACMLSLVVFVDAPELDHASDMAAELAVHHPSRTILVAVDPESSENSLSAEVSARCHMSFGRRQQICSEQVIIKSSGRSIEEVHGIVLPLLTSDLPSFLWWRSSKWPDGPSFKNIAASCDRVVIDSSRLSNSLADFRRLNDMVHGGQRGQNVRFSVADLNWSRMTPWRTVLAELYDVPSFRHQLGLARHFELTYSPKPGDADRSSNAERIPSTALLAAGWLASRLGWEGPHEVERSGDSLSLGFSCAGHHVELKLTPDAGSDRHPDAVENDKAQTLAGTSYGLQVETGREPLTTFSVVLSEGCIQTKIVIEGESQTPRIVGCGEVGEPDLVGEELDILGHDSTYEEAVKAGADIASAVSKA